MATSDQIRYLVQCHYQGDWQRFNAAVLQIAAHDEKKSPAFSQELRRLANQGASTREIKTRPTFEAEGAIAIAPSTITLDKMVLDDNTRNHVERLLREQRGREKLFVHGFDPIRKLLLSGPPGVGKSMLASAIAGELGIPLARVQLHAVLTSYLGETSKKLAKVFDTIERVRAVYLFDEFDALAARRDNREDVGEMRRVVNSLLVMIEQVQSDSLIVAATNLGTMIDRAMFRRFDVRIELPMPCWEAVERLLDAHLLHVDKWSSAERDCVVSAASLGKLSHADIVAICRQINKNVVLAGADHVDVDDVVRASKHVEELVPA